MPVFELNLQDYLNFKRMMKKAPKIYSRAGASVLNSAAFGTRKLAIRNIKSNMIARNNRFIEGSVRVEKARRGTPLSSNRSTVGSIKRDRFSGWREQEGGQQTKREHYAHPAGRRGTIQKQIVNVARLRNSGKFPKPSDFRGGGPLKARAARMIHILSRSGFTRPFLIFGLENKTRGRKIPPGVYRFGAGQYPTRKIKLLQRFKSPKKTQRKPWLQPAAANYVERVNLRVVWGRALEREFRRVGMR